MYRALEKVWAFPVWHRAISCQGETDPMGSGIAVKQSADVGRHRVSKCKKNRKRAMMGKSLMSKIRLSEHMLVDEHSVSKQQVSRLPACDA